MIIQINEKIPLKSNLHLNEKKIIKKNYYKIFCKIIFKTNSYIYISFFISYLLYIFSLEKCTEGMDECPRNINWIKRKVKQIIFSCLIMMILIELIIYKKISHLHLIHIIFVFLIFYSYSHGIDFEDHGFYNLKGYFVLFFALVIIFLPINGFIYLIQKKKKKIIIFTYIAILIFILIIINILYNKYTTDCSSWPKGLNNTFLDNDSIKYGCQITFPKRCPYPVFKNFLDYTKFVGKECKNLNINAKQKLLKLSNSPFINDKVTHIGYPLTNKDPVCNLDFIDTDNLIEKYFFQNLVDMENKSSINEYYKNKIPEIEIDFSKNIYGEMNINLNFNKTLSEERILLERNSIPYSNNLIILYIDSVSRANSLRQLKKTLNFFEEFMSYKGAFQEKNPNDNFHSFQFFKYHSFLFHTPYNYPILFYGRSRNSSIVLITKYLKEAGYVTCYSGELCDKDNTRTLHNLTNEEVYDHQFILCDPNKDHFSINTIRCLYQKQTIEHLYEYSNQFWRKYKVNRKFLSIVTNDGHEGTLEVLKYADNIIFTFLNKLFNDNLLKDSSIILLSDHGVGMPSIYYPYDFYKLEEQLPMLYLIINDRKNISYEGQYKYLHENQQTFISSYDIYNTIGNLIFGDEYKFIKNKTEDNDTPKSQYGKSLFEKINQKIRTPQFYKNIGDMVDYICK